jgi:hypothetical protein
MGLSHWIPPFPQGVKVMHLSFPICNIFKECNHQQQGYTVPLQWGLLVYKTVPTSRKFQNLKK